jgi:hypothetical protein
MKRCCIVGTAGTWKQTPWADPSLEIWSINDAYSLGLPRADRWFDQHPLDHFVYRKMNQKIVDPRDVPPGHYVRPEGHIDWLKHFARTNPVYLQHEPPDGWPPNAQRFPLERVEAVFGKDYWACGPSYMLALAVLEGYEDIWITGIHLSTQHEYIEQRPNWEHLLGRVLGVNVTMTVKDGFRYYDGAVRIVLPESCPILTHQWKYAYEPRPMPKVNPYHEELKAARKELARLMEALVNWPVGRNKQPALERLARLKVVVFDCEQQLAKQQTGGTLVAKLAA